MSDFPNEVDAERARELLGSGEARALDIRSKDEAAKATPPGALWVPEGELDEKVTYIRRGDDIPLLIVCSDGSESADVASKLREDGIPAAHIDGGFAAWEAADNPVNPRSDTEYEGPELTQPGTGGSMQGDESAEDKKIEEHAEATGGDADSGSAQTGDGDGESSG